MANDPNADVEQMLDELESDSAKRRWATIQRLTKLGVEDDRFIDALKTMAVQDPQVYVRDEALATLKLPKYQALVRQRNEAIEKTAAEQARKTTQTVTPPPPPRSPMSTPPPPPRAPINSTSATPPPQVSQATTAPLPTSAGAASRAEVTHCTECGFGNPKDMKFCQNCGKPLAVQCPKCGLQNAGGVKFCGNCGTSLAQQVTPAPTATVQPATETISPALREALARRGDNKDPKRMAVRYEAQRISVIEDCMRIVSLLEFDEKDIVTNYEKLNWGQNASGVYTVSYGTRDISLSSDMKEGMDTIIQTFNTDGMMKAFSDEYLGEPLAVIKGWHNFTVCNIPLFGTDKKPEGFPVIFYSPFAIVHQGEKETENEFAFVPEIISDIVVGFLGVSDATTLLETCLKNGDKFEIEYIVVGQPMPTTKKCISCSREILEEARFCYKCNAPQDEAVANVVAWKEGRASNPFGMPEPELWEFCEIVWEGKKSGASGAFNIAMKAAFDGGNPFGASYSHIQLWVSASSPAGNYIAGTTEWLRAPGYPDPRNKNHVRAHEQLVSKLLQEGWEPTAQGELWYNAHFRRRFRR